MTSLQSPLRGIRLVTFDAFGTIFHPKPPVAQQYLTEVRRHGLLLPHQEEELSESAIASTFRDGEVKKRKEKENCERCSECDFHYIYLTYTEKNLLLFL